MDCICLCYRDVNCITSLRDDDTSEEELKE